MLVLDFNSLKFFEIWSIFKKVLYDNMKKIYEFSVMPTGLTIDAMILKFLSGTYMLLKVDCFGSFVIRNKIDGFMIYYTSRCNFLH